MKFVVLFCAILALSQSAPPQNRIVGGQIAEPGQFKYIASLRQDYHNWHFCGAAIISPRTLVTAANCKIYVDASEMVAVVGTTKQNDATARRIPVEAFIAHPDYNPFHITNDIAVVILKEDIEFSDFVQPLSLASGNWEAGQRFTTSGWGYIQHPNGTTINDLQWMRMNALSQKDCKSKSPEDAPSVVGKICTLESTGHGVCFGDSGGPLVNDQGQLVGVTSSAFMCALGYPDYFTDIWYQRDWILANAHM